MDYVQRMRDLREDHDKTQQEIADILGTSQTMYARYERAANELPIHHLLQLLPCLCRLFSGAIRCQAALPYEEKPKAQKIKRLPSTLP